MNAKIAPVKIHGKFSGKVVVKKAFSGEAPRLIVARTTNHRRAYISDIISKNQISCVLIFYRY